MLFEDLTSEYTFCVGFSNKIKCFCVFGRKLKRLNLGGNHLTQIPQKALSIFDNLKKLEVQENRIETIKEGDFEGLRNLDSLILAHNKLRTIPGRVFSHLRQLNSLELEGNLITSVDAEAFAGLEGKMELKKSIMGNAIRIHMKRWN